MSGIRVAVTGATGFIGTHLCRAMATQGTVVTALVRTGSDTSRLEAPNIILAPTDFSVGALRGVLEAQHPQAVIHLATRWIVDHRPDDIDGLLETNVMLGCRLLEAMSLAGCDRILNAGTFFQHYDQSPYNPVNLNAATKQAFEAILAYYVEARSFQAITIELFDTYGPGDTRNKLTTLLIQAALLGHPIDLSPGEQLLDLLYISDAVQGFQTALKRLLDGPVKGHMRFSLPSPQRITVRNLAAEVEQVTGKRIAATWGGRPYRAREVFVPYSGTPALPDWHPAVTLAEGLTALVRELETGSLARCP